MSNNPEISGSVIVGNQTSFSAGSCPSIPCIDSIVLPRVVKFSRALEVFS